MKKKLTLLLFITAAALKTSAQVELYESFTAPFNPAANGWSVQDLSSAPGTNASGWFQGTPAKFNAITGNNSDYLAADMNSASQAGATNTISCWLITPTLNLANGAFLQFAFKGSTLPVAKADRLQVYFSYGTGTNVGTAVGSATNTAGTFTNIIMDFNPNLSATGFAQLWSVATRSLSGITTPGVGRLAFRYYVPNGGPGGPNGNYIGIDEVRYSQPCARPQHFGDITTVQSCSGQVTPLFITNTSPAVAISSYTWFTGANTNSTSITYNTADLSEIWSLVESTPGCQNLNVSFVTTFTVPSVTYSFNPGNSLCAGSHVTVSASGASSYTYVLGSTSSSTLNPIALVTPSNITSPATVQFTLAGKANNINCVHRQVLTLTVSPNPTVNISVAQSVICMNNIVTLTAGGAATYSWSGTTASTMTAVNYTGATAGVKQFTLYGVSAQGCRSADAVASVTVAACTGIAHEQEGADALLAYPNPFNSQLNFNDFSGTLAIYDQLGRLVHEQNADGLKVMDTSALPAGIYIIKMVSARGFENNLRLLKN